MGLMQLDDSRRPCSAARAALLLASTALVGCAGFAPAGLGSLSAKHHEQKIVKQAANDPFPSPSDVGLGSAEKTKTL
jgi:hypothetical protein